MKYWIAQGELMRYKEGADNIMVLLKDAGFPEYALTAAATAQVLTNDNLGRVHACDSVLWHTGPNKTHLLSP